MNLFLKEKLKVNYICPTTETFNNSVKFYSWPWPWSFSSCLIIIIYFYDSYHLSGIIRHKHYLTLNCWTDCGYLSSLSMTSNILKRKKRSRVKILCWCQKTKAHNSDFFLFTSKKEAKNWTVLNLIEWIIFSLSSTDTQNQCEENDLIKIHYSFQPEIGIVCPIDYKKFPFQKPVCEMKISSNIEFNDTLIYKVNINFCNLAKLF